MTILLLSSSFHRQDVTAVCLTLLWMFINVAAASSIVVKPTTTIHGVLQYPDQSPFNITTRVTLNHGEISTYSKTIDGSFTLYHVPPGIHVIDVHSPTYHFSQIKIQVLEEDIDHPKCIEYAYPGAAKRPLETCDPVVLTTLAMYDYYEKRSGFSIFFFLKNPMVIMMLFSVGMMFFMPKLMDNLEPEEKERMKKQMAMQQDPTKMLSSLWGDITGAEEEDKSPTKKSIKAKRSKE